MDVLKNKQLKTYDYISRYVTFPIYYHILDNKYIYGKTAQLDKNTSYVLHKLIQKDTLDSLANYYYGRPDLYWVIANFNNINDCFINLYDNFKSIKIPALGSIRFKN